MLVRFAAVAAVMVSGGALASTAPAYADAPLEGTYRLDFDGAYRTIDGAPRPIADTSSTYSFTSSCSDTGCTASAVLLNSSDKEAVSMHNPELTLQLVDGTWQLSLPYDSPCEQPDEERNQLLTWSLTPKGDGLSGTRAVATIGHSCAGDDTGTLAQPVTATRVGASAPGVLPML
jgi:serine/threonine-protein kinase